MTAVPLPTLTDTGLASPAASDVLAGVQTDWNTAFGGNLNLADETPQGQVITAEAAQISATYDLFLLFCNLIDPSYSSGRMQDAIARIYFLDRNPPLPTTVEAVCSGATGTVIPIGSLAIAADGNIYNSIEAGTIGSSGTVTITFACINTGPIICSAGTLNQVLKAIPGWDSITNPADGSPGRDVEGRADFEARRGATVAANASGTLPAIRGAVLKVPGVTDAYVIDNPTTADATIGGVVIPAGALFVSAAGGADIDVATAIWSKKNPGCPYTGNTTETVTDTNSGYSLPYPTYDVTFTRPSNLTITFAITIANSVSVPSDAIMQVKNAVLSAFNGEDGGQRAKIGSTIFALRYAGVIQALGAWAQLISITVNGAADVTAHIDQLPVTDASHIGVTLA